MTRNELPGPKMHPGMRVGCVCSLTTKTVEKIIRAGLAGMTNDGDGLYLKVGRSGGASWIFRYKIAGKSRDMGLGGSPEVSLAKAREKAAEARSRSAHQS
ncbi:Arm DNA-binding domain-containing protein [Pseudomonas mandelii]|nr:MULTISPECIES: Arm DNA-binding domain-containing protein [Pseudomonas]